jgi:hypothetical protein
MRLLIHKLLNQRLSRRVNYYKTISNVQKESDNLQIREVFENISKYIPHLLTITDGEIFKWNTKFSEAIPLPLETLKLFENYSIVHKHIEIYEEKKLEYIPLNLLFICLYDLLREYNFPISEYAFRNITATMQSYCPKESKMTNDVFSMYLERFNSNISAIPSKKSSLTYQKNKIVDARELFLHNVIKRLQSSKPAKIVYIEA